MKKRAFVKKLKVTRLARGQFRRVCSNKTIRFRRYIAIRSKVRGFLIHGMIYRSLRESLQRYLGVKLLRVVS